MALECLFASHGPGQGAMVRLWRVCGVYALLTEQFCEEQRKVRLSDARKWLREVEDYRIDECR